MIVDVLVYIAICSVALFVIKLIGQDLTSAPERGRPQDLVCDLVYGTTYRIPRMLSFCYINRRVDTHKCQTTMVE